MLVGAVLAPLALALSPLAPPRPNPMRAPAPAMLLPKAATDIAPTGIWVRQAGLMWISAALLGPLCDGRHSAHDVLHYATDSIAGAPWIFTLGGTKLLETCWWVPIAFGGAGVILGAAHPILDRLWGDAPRPPPGWPAVLLNIFSFVACCVPPFWIGLGIAPCPIVSLSLTTDRNLAARRRALGRAGAGRGRARRAQLHGSRRAAARQCGGHLPHL